MDIRNNWTIMMDQIIMMTVLTYYTLTISTFHSLSRLITIITMTTAMGNIYYISY